jgi:hypothetical protein
MFDFTDMLTAGQKISMELPSGEAKDFMRVKSLSGWSCDHGWVSADLVCPMEVAFNAKGISLVDCKIMLTLKKKTEEKK